MEKEVDQVFITGMKMVHCLVMSSKFPPWQVVLADANVGSYAAIVAIVFTHPLIFANMSNITFSNTLLKNP